MPKAQRGVSWLDPPSGGLAYWPRWSSWSPERSTPARRPINPTCRVPRQSPATCARSASIRWLRLASVEGAQPARSPHSRAGLPRPHDRVVDDAYVPALMAKRGTEACFVGTSRRGHSEANGRQSAPAGACCRGRSSSARTEGGGRSSRPRTGQLCREKPAGSSNLHRRCRYFLRLALELERAPVTPLTGWVGSPGYPDLVARWIGARDRPLATAGHDGSPSYGSHIMPRPRGGRQGRRRRRRGRSAADLRPCRTGPTAVLQLVPRDNAETDELRARDALQSSGAGSTAAGDCSWANSSVSRGHQ